MEEVRVQYGTGPVAADGWLNFDASPSLWLERLPLVGSIITPKRFEGAVMFGNIVTGLPIKKGTVCAVYASHVLEHLSYDDYWIAIRNTYDMLCGGGVFRLIVPDLGTRARRYLENFERGDPEAATRFMKETYLGQIAKPRTLSQMLRGMLGNAQHLWMWDQASVVESLERVGFVGVRRCRFGDASDPSFANVESLDRFVDAGTGDIEVAIEARKPEAGI